MADPTGPCKYSGADWIASAHSLTPSPLGREVADILGQAFLGIYHIKTRRVDWTDPHCITINLFWDFATVDADRLTALVVLCHDRAIRLEISPKNFRYLELMFHQRSRKGGISKRHPTMEEAIERIRGSRGLPIITAEEAPDAAV